MKERKNERKKEKKKESKRKGVQILLSMLIISRSKDLWKILMFD